MDKKADIQLRDLEDYELKFERRGKAIIIKAGCWNLMITIAEAHKIIDALKKMISIPLTPKDYWKELSVEVR